MTVELPAMDLRYGDAIIGDDGKEYLIERIEEHYGAREDPFITAEPTVPEQVITHYTVHALTVDGQAVKTDLPPMCYLEVIRERDKDIDYLVDKSFGFKICENCGKARSKARNWSPDDYMCKVCRNELDSLV